MCYGRMNGPFQWQLQQLQPTLFSAGAVNTRTAPADTEDASRATDEHGSVAGHQTPGTPSARMLMENGRNGLKNR